MADERGQGSVEAIAAAVMLIAVAGLVVQVALVIATAGAAQADVQRALDTPSGGSGVEVIVRRRTVPTLSGLGPLEVSARGATLRPAG